MEVRDQGGRVERAGMYQVVLKRGGEDQRRMGGESRNGSSCVEERRKDQVVVNRGVED